MEKYFRAGQVTGDNMAHAHFTLDTSSYKHTLTICNNYCFSTATVIVRTHSNVTLYVHCPSCPKQSSTNIKTPNTLHLHTMIIPELNMDLCYLQCFYLCFYLCYLQCFYLCYLQCFYLCNLQCSYL